MGLLSTAPVLGAGFVLAPAEIILALQGNWPSGLILIAYVWLIISMLDNIVVSAIVLEVSATCGFYKSPYSIPAKIMTKTHVSTKQTIRDLQSSISASRFYRFAFKRMS